jgi:putative aldouronate transport system substrate-binding protein
MTDAQQQLPRSGGSPGSSPAGGMSRRDLIRYGVGAGVAAAASPALLAACGGGKGNSGGNDTKGLEGVPKVELGAETSGVQYPEGYIGPKAREVKAFADGKQTFRIVVPVDTVVTGDWNKNAFTQYMEQKTGLKVQFQTVTTSGPNGTDMTKVNAMMAAGDLPDAFLGIPFTRDQLSLYGSQGVFTPLDDLIETYAPQMRQAMTDYPDLRALNKGTDGKTYSFAGLNDCYHCAISPGRALIYKPWLDKLGLDMPQTTEDLRTVLKAFKEKNPNGHGNAIPFAAGADNPLDRYFMNAFLYNPGEPWLRLDNDKVDFVANKPQWREALKYLRSLYDDGLLTNDVFSMTTEALTRLGNNPGYPRLGFVRAYYWGSFIDITYNGGGKDRWRDYVPVPALQGPDKTRIAAWGHYVAYGSAGLQISSKVKNPELLVQWADHQMELEATVFGYGGLKGKNWSWAKAGQKGINGKQAIYALDIWPAPVNTSWNQYSIMYRTNDFRLCQYADPKNPNFEKDLYEASTTPYQPYASKKEWELPPVIFDESQAAQNADTATSLSNHVKQSMAQFATGKKDINDDAAWDSYLKDMDKMGLPAYLSNYQQAYDNRPKG